MAVPCQQRSLGPTPKTVDASYANLSTRNGNVCDTWTVSDLKVANDIVSNGNASIRGEVIASCLIVPEVNAAGSDTGADTFAVCSSGCVRAKCIETEKLSVNGVNVTGSGGGGGSLQPTGVTPGTYENSTVTVNQFGQVTAAASNTVFGYRAQAGPDSFFVGTTTVFTSPVVVTPTNNRIVVHFTANVDYSSGLLTTVVFKLQRNGANLPEPNTWEMFAAPPVAGSTQLLVHFTMVDQTAPIGIPASYNVQVTVTGGAITVANRNLIVFQQ